MAAARTLTGKVAVVTGASSGIGAAAARALARAGATVMLAARRVDRLQALADRLNADGRGPALVAQTDVTREEDRIALIERARTVTGEVDIFVNNAGFAQPGAVEDLALPDLRAQFEANFFAPVQLMQLVIPRMRERGEGRIINVSSVSGRLATPGLGAYAASKSALEAISDAARVELAPFGVHVAVIEPGAIKTEIWDVGLALGAPLGNGGTPYEGLYRGQFRRVDLAKRMGAEPQVVARAVLHAAAAPRPRARYVMPLEAQLNLAIARLPTTVRDPLLRRALGHRPRRRVS